MTLQRNILIWLATVFVLSFISIFRGHGKPWSRYYSQKQRVLCTPHVPCSYPESVDLRIIVLTYNRNDSLLKLLQSLDHLELDGDAAALEIWIDRGKDGTYHQETVRAADDFIWRLGPKRVHLQAEHVGIHGQWIDTWRPPRPPVTRGARSSEIALFLEDDMSVSRFAWRWVKGVYHHFHNQSDFMGVTLRCHQVYSSLNHGIPLKFNHEDTMFMYWALGPWGFAPHPEIWRDFQDWYHKIIYDIDFKPYVGGGQVHDQWYKTFEKKGKAGSMWTIWFMYYTQHVRKNSYCVYSNLNRYFKKTDLCLGVNRMEDGLHFVGRTEDNEKFLMSAWDDSFLAYPNPIVRVDIEETQLTNYK